MEPAYEDKDLQTDSPHISWPLNRPPDGTVHAHVFGPENQSLNATSMIERIAPAQRNRDTSRASDAIAIRAFLLGTSVGVNGITTCILIFHGYRIWRASFFIASLCLFHFLEFYMTAAYNPRYADVSAFLLSTNGRAYNLAHTAALVECLVTSVLLPGWQSFVGSNPLIIFGLLAMLVGQVSRSTAMAHAGTNFNHTVQIRKAEGHRLVTEGIYKYLRHPSYFGFFWWGIGTQLVLGNAICSLAYTGILWNFFWNRIRKEEEYLVMFFGKEYEDYRSRTKVRIPFIR